MLTHRTSISRSLVFAALIVALALALGACKGERSLSSPSSPATEQTANTVPAALPLLPTRALVVTIDTRIRVSDVQSATRALRAAVAKYGGYVAQGNERDDDGSEAAVFEARIPSDKVEAFREELRKLGEIVSSSEKVEDITDRRNDLEARLSNARLQEKRLLQLLGDRTGSLAEVMAVEKELSAVRENIETLEARQRGMAEQIRYATVHLHLEPLTVAAWQNPGSSLWRAAQNGVRHAGAFAVGASVVFLNVAPTLIILGVVGLLFVLLIRRLSRPRPARTPTAL